MKEITESELRFLEHRQLKRETFGIVANAEEVAIELGYCYIIAQEEANKEQAAWLINGIQSKYKNYLRSLGFVFGEEFKRLVDNRLRKVNEKNRTSQKRRHERREDFALTEDEWKDTLNYFNHLCAYCLADGKLTYDHFIPFSKGGSFTKKNIVPCCRSCNSSKKDNKFEAWYQGQNYYCEKQKKRILQFVANEEVGVM